MAVGDISEAKQLGSYYTTRFVVRFLVDWAIRSSEDKVLDPGCGDARFLAEAFHRLKELGAAPEKAAANIYGIELDKKSFKQSEENLKAEIGYLPNIFNGDFFDFSPPKTDLTTFVDAKIPYVDVAIGNPPYIRYQLLSEKIKEKGLKRAAAAGVKLSELTSSWAPFLIHSSRFLTKNGRLAMVIPAEIFYVQYAEPVRRLLRESFDRIVMLSFDERFFEGILEEVVLLLAEKKSEKRGIQFVRFANISELSNFESAISEAPLLKEVESRKWIGYHLPFSTQRLYQEILKMKKVVNLSALASVDIGVVTGANDFFTLSRDEVHNLGIPDKYLRPVVSKANNLDGSIFTRGDWENIRDAGEKCYLLELKSKQDAKEPSISAYLEEGVKQGIQKRYKCSIRDPWYSVPYIKTPKALLTYMSHDFPRVALNEAEVVNTNTIHGIFFKPELSAITTAFYSTLTLLSSELKGRSYGGGVHKLEPTEAEDLAIVDLRIIDDATKKELSSMFHDIDSLVRKRDLQAIMAVLDEILLEGVLGLTKGEIEKLRDAFSFLREKRLLRAKKTIEHGG